jgi:hypothetical protein
MSTVALRTCHVPATLVEVFVNTLDTFATTGHGRRRFVATLQTDGLGGLPLVARLSNISADSVRRWSCGLGAASPSFHEVERPWSSSS